ncbi:unnamed protein product [Spirodela intermedia]|uniref:SNF2 N-terminal domain-containing protein n=1 Tax=Spirodela intermedia TaxID=51605 RepID=A0A7I8IY92_SPIIN|nr:unnamed protein product [Spirodela intermedia]CAA6662769.1 unnamed protein product [Spirodela intermedia]
MSLALEYSKGTVSDNTAAVAMVQEHPEDCEHDYLLKDDIGVVCQVCGVIKKRISTIFDYQWRKVLDNLLIFGSQTTKTYTYGSQKSKDIDEDMRFPGPKFSEYDFFSAKLSIHPRHLEQMKPHQIQGFNFLMKNLVGDKPGGCICFIQSFLARFPSARPLIILPKGILPTWKREFQRWQVEDILLFDFYSVKAESRSQQLERSLLGYKQFSCIICDVKDKIGAACQERLLKVPSLLILDEGHTPRNEDTDILSTLAKVQTPLKVVLSGTLFQNRVKEVFNILNLVRCRFLKMESSRTVVKRILSRVHAPGRRRRNMKGDTEATFFELVEETLQNDEDFTRRVGIIRDLREMTRDVLHYYKGDFLEELPGHADFTLGNYDKFKRISVESAIYLHPCLKDFAAHASGNRSIKVTDKEIDHLLDSIDVKDGVKTKFLVDILSMADAAGEKVLVFSQYILPLRFLERLFARIKGWRSGKEIFAISGDTNTERREWAMEQGISLVGASRVIILDVHLNPSVSQQAIARAFRPGQTKRVFTYRLVAADSPEEKYHYSCFRKELIAKMWFEWDEHCGHRQFELESARVQDCQDLFLTHLHSEDVIKALYRR